jgi:aminodeoxyfutalosine synthase
LDSNFEAVSALADLEEAVASRRVLSPTELARVAGCPDLPGVGQLGELARKARHGNRVTYLLVLALPGQSGSSPTIPPAPEAEQTRGEGEPLELGEAAELRLIGCPESLAEARARVRTVVRSAGSIPVTGFSLAELWRLAGHDLRALAELAAALASEGLESIAEAPLDELGNLRTATSILVAVTRAGLRAPRATLTRAVFSDRLELIHLAASLQRDTGGFTAFAPLPRIDPQDQPSTGYDDARTIALARLICGDIPSIQVDWRLHGPKLAQVAITFGADDIDNVPAISRPELGRRRSSREDIERQIRAAFAEPVPRGGRDGVRA